MKKILCGLAFIGLAACGPREVTQPAPVTVTNTVTQTATPTKKQSPVSDQCVHHDLPADWPVEKVMEIWNSNGRNFLRTYTVGSNCTYHIAMHLVPDLGNSSGTTIYHQNASTVILISQKTPKNMRQSILCHELGHALGVPHSTDPTSCMQTNVAMMPTLPSANDLQTAGKEVWEWASAFKRAGVH